MHGDDGKGNGYKKGDGISSSGGVQCTALSVFLVPEVWNAWSWVFVEGDERSDVPPVLSILVCFPPLFLNFLGRFFFLCGRSPYHWTLVVHRLWMWMRLGRRYDFSSSRW